MSHARPPHPQPSPITRPFADSFAEVQGRASESTPHRGKLAAVGVAISLGLFLVIGMLAPLSRHLARALTGVSSVSTSVSAAKRTELQTSLTRMPLYFVENRGQIDPQVAYYVHGKDASVYFTAHSVTYALSPSATTTATQPSPSSRWVVTVEFVGANPAAKAHGEKPTTTSINYFRGNQADWKTGVPTFGRVTYTDLWPGIDLIFDGSAAQLKYTFVAHAGADAGQIKLAYHGASAVTLTATGQLQVASPAGEFREDVPYAYQEPAAEEHGAKAQQSVTMAYTQRERSADGAPIVGFQIGGYDHAQTLFLDPVVLIYCGYIGGAGDDVGQGIAIDSAGNAYVTGQTDSDELSFPVTTGPDLTYNGGPGGFNGGGDAFVVKVDPTGTSLIYAGYIGGKGEDKGMDIAVDSSGNAYIAGSTNSDQSSFPVTMGPDLIYNGGTDAFVAKVAASGKKLLYAGYIGGKGYDSASGIAVDNIGSAYIVGSTNSNQSSFPVKVGPDLSYNGGVDDVFVAQIAVTTPTLVYCGYIGGVGDDVGNGIALDANGDAYVVGYTDSTQQSFPVIRGPDLTANGGIDAFVAKVNPSGSALLYCGYIGGVSTDYGFGIAVDASGYAYITGMTGSTQSSFPVLVGPYLQFVGFVNSAEAFVAKIYPGGEALLYCGYIGGFGISDTGVGIAVDDGGNAYVVGYTDSDELTFHVIDGPDLTYNGGQLDAFVAKVRPDGSALVYCGYIGGMGRDQGYAIAVDAKGDAYVNGSTQSDETTFPVTKGPDLTYNDGLIPLDAFVAKIHAS